MDKKAKWFQFWVVLTFAIFSNNQIFAQKEITAVFPPDGASNVNIGILKWSAQIGLKYDLYFGLSTDPTYSGAYPPTNSGRIRSA